MFSFNGTTISLTVNFSSNLSSVCITEDSFMFSFIYLFRFANIESLIILEIKFISMWRQIQQTRRLMCCVHFSKIVYWFKLNWLLLSNIIFCFLSYLHTYTRNGCSHNCATFYETANTINISFVWFPVFIVKPVNFLWIVSFCGPDDVSYWFYNKRLQIKKWKKPQNNGILFKINTYQLPSITQKLFNIYNAYKPNCCATSSFYQIKTKI